MRAKASNVPANYWSDYGYKYRTSSELDDRVTMVGKDLRAQVRVPHSQGYATYRIDLDLERLIDLVSWHPAGRQVLIDAVARFGERDAVVLSDFHSVLMQEAGCAKCSASLYEPCRNMRTQVALREPHPERGGSWVRDRIKSRLRP